MTYATSFRNPVGNDLAATGWRTDPLNNGVYSFGADYGSDAPSVPRGRGETIHMGVDWNRGTYDADFGDPVFAVANGTVIYVGSPWDGEVVVIRHELPPGTTSPSGGQFAYSVYAHLGNTSVAVDQNVWIGQQIAEIGDPIALFAHLHYEMRDAWTGALDDGYAQDVNGTQKDGDRGWFNPAPFTAVLQADAINDDFAEDASTSGRLEIGVVGQDQIWGVLEQRPEGQFDRDWFAVDLQVGHTYTFALRGVDTADQIEGTPTLADPSLRIRDPQGNQITWTGQPGASGQQTADFGAGGRDVRVTFTAEQTGTYYLVAFSASGETGSYRLSGIESNPRFDDVTIVNLNLDSSTLVLGESYQAQWAVHNLGQNSVLSGGYSRIYLSTDNRPNSDDIVLVQERFSSLSAAGSETEERLFVLPEGTAPGTYWIWGISAPIEITDTNRLNNITTPIQIEVVDLGAAPERVQTGSLPEPFISLSASEYASIQAQSAVYTGDTSPPTLLSSNTQTAQIGLESSIVLQFSEAVLPTQGGTIDVFRSDGTYWDLIAVNASNWVAFSGSTLTITPPGSFTNGQSYYININPGVFVDLSGNAFAGIQDATSLSFTVSEENSSGNSGGEALPDLTVTSLNLQETRFDSGEHVNFSANIQNIGTEVAAQSDVTVYVTTDTNFENAEYLFREDFLALSAGQGGQFNGYFYYYNDPGDYYLAFVVDDRGVITENDETNNIAFVPFTLTGSTTDTAPPSLMSTTPGIGSSNVPVGNEIVFTFSEDVVAANGDVRILRDLALVDTINISDESRISIEGRSLTVTLSEDLSYAADYEIRLTPGIVQDLSGNLFQGVPSGSEIRFSTAIGPAPDVLFASFEVHDQVVTAGDAIAASWTIRNDGDRDAVFGIARIYLSYDAQPSDDDRAIAVQSFSSIQPGQSVGFSYDDIVIPLSESLGDYWIWAELHITNGVEENIENNRATPALVSIIPVNSAPIGIVTISGTAREGATLTANTSAIADADGLGAFSYQWFADGVVIEGATAETLTLAQAQDGQTITVRVNYTDGFGAAESLNSSSTSAVLNVNDAPTGAVTISGTARQGSVLTAQTATIADADGLGAFSYQWLRDGTPITGANSRTYTLSDDDIGEPISVRITYTDGGGTTETLTSAATDAVTSAIPPETTIPTDAADSIIGTELSEIITSRGGNDFITASKGNDRIDGGLGIDTVLYDGNQNSYTVTLTSSGVQVRDRRTDGNGTDTLTNTEFLVFDAGPYAEFNLTQFGSAASLNEEAFRGFIELYVAYYNRAPDAIGLNFWGTAYANGTSMEEMATLFAGQSETLRFYPENVSNAEFAAAVYNNVLGRTPDQAGFNFWVNSLNSGFVSRDQFILEVLDGVQDGSTDRVYLDNKVNVGAYFAVHKGLSDTSEAAIAMALYDGSNLSLQSVKQTVDSFHAAALDPLNGDFLLPLVGVLADPFA